MRERTTEGLWVLRRAVDGVLDSKAEREGQANSCGLEIRAKQSLSHLYTMHIPMGF